MARTVKEQEYAEKRNAILDVTQRLVYTKGYEQMTIQDILDDLQISKGAFYHYFDSKQALLEALIERMQQEVEHLLTPIAHDPHLPALEKLQRTFAALAHWKTAQKAFLLALLRVWYTDDNAIVRQKARAAMTKRITPLLATIIHQGLQEGVLTTPYPDQVSGIALSLIQDLSDTLAGLLLSFEPQRDDLRHVESIVVAYTDALERVLGAPATSLQFVDAEMLKQWFVSPQDNV
ncbi:MAG: TetR/AcrR family transcriptional regulator [Chloroflexi bacterium]|nr:TetR/AcrR family transcriptional regulator [Chloroflexota bacterium]